MGSLSNDYGDGNENNKKVMGFYKQKNLHVSRFLYISNKLSLHVSDMKLPNFMRPLRSTWTQHNIILFPLLNWVQP